MRYGWSDVIVQQVASTTLIGTGWSNRPAWEGLARILDLRVRVKKDGAGSIALRDVRVVFAPSSSGSSGLMNAALSISMAAPVPADPLLTDAVELVIATGNAAGRILVPCPSPFVAVVVEQSGAWVVTDYQVLTRYRRESDA